MNLAVSLRSQVEIESICSDIIPGYVSYRSQWWEEGQKGKRQNVVSRHCALIMRFFSEREI